MLSFANTEDLTIVDDCGVTLMATECQRVGKV